MKDFIWYDKDGNRHTGKIVATSRTIIGWKDIEVPIDGTKTDSSQIITSTDDRRGYKTDKVPVYDEKDDSINLFVMDDVVENNTMYCVPSQYMKVVPELKGASQILHAQIFKVSGHMAANYEY